MRPIPKLININKYYGYQFTKIVNHIDYENVCQRALQILYKSYIMFF